MDFDLGDVGIGSSILDNVNPSKCKNSSFIQNYKRLPAHIHIDFDIITAKIITYKKYTNIKKVKKEGTTIKDCQIKNIITNDKLISSLISPSVSIRHKSPSTEDEINLFF